MDGWWQEEPRGPSCTRAQWARQHVLCNGQAVKHAAEKAVKQAVKQVVGLRPHMWYLSRMKRHCSLVRPVKLNMPICVCVGGGGVRG